MSARSNPASGTPATGRRARVCVASDSPGVWSMATEALARPIEGLTVEPYRLQDMRAVFQHKGPPPDLLLADLTGPFDDGLAASKQGRALLARQPSVVLCNPAQQAVMRDLLFEGVLSDFFAIGGAVDPAYLDVILWRILRQVASRGVPAPGRAAAPAKGKTGGTANFAGKRALVIDDDLPSLTLASDYLEVAGFEVLTASTVAAACLHHRSRKLDVVLLDLFMAGVSGARAVRMVREHFAPSTMPIVVTSAYSDVDLVKACIKEGISAYLVKPIRKTVLLDKLDTLLPR